MRVQGASVHASPMSSHLYLVFDEFYEFMCLMSSMSSCVSSMRSLASWITIDTFDERGECTSDLSH